MLYFLGGKSCDAFVHPAFFLVGNRVRNGVAIVVRFKTCVLWELVFNYFIAYGFCDRSAQFLVNCF